MKRSHIFSLVAAASFVVTWPVVWFVLDVDLHLKKASATTSTAVPSNAVALEPFKTAHAANPTTTMLLALDRARHLAFWTSILKIESRRAMLLFGPGTKAALNPGSITGALAA